MKPKITLSPILHHQKRFRQRIEYIGVYKGNTYEEDHECWGDTLEELQELVNRNLRYKELMI